MTKTILAIEPDAAILRLIRILLLDAGYEVTSDYSDEQQPPSADLTLIDITPPYEESVSTFGVIRKASFRPILAISTTTEEPVKQAVVEAGVDDFMSLPFEPDEFLARLHFLLSEPERVESGQSPLAFGSFEVDFDRRVVLIRGERVSLSYSEWLLLECLAEAPGQPCLVGELLAKVWGPGSKYDHQFLKLWIHRLQGKLGLGPPDSPSIRPYHDVGYVLVL